MSVPVATGTSNQHDLYDRVEKNVIELNSKEIPIVSSILFFFFFSSCETRAIIETPSPSRRDDEMHPWRGGRRRGDGAIARLQSGNGDSRHHTNRDEAARMEDGERGGNGRKRKIEGGLREKRCRDGEEGGEGRGGRRRRCERRVGFHVELQQRATDVSRREARGKLG